MKPHIRQYQKKKPWLKMYYPFYKQRINVAMNIIEQIDIVLIAYNAHLAC